jgi:hypothetical protein
MDFIQIANRIFVNRDLYHEVSDEDKVNSFFIINRKFGKNFPKIARKFNHRFVDKASSIDLWYTFFNGSQKIPDWYWDPKDRVKKTKTSKKGNYDIIQQREELSDIEMKYLETYYEDDLKKEIKKLNKFEE